MLPKIFLLIVVINQSIAWRTFHLGKRLDRHFDENLQKKAMQDPHITEAYFDQRLDHFTPLNTQKWKQRYFVNDKYYNNTSSNGPVFLSIGGEGSEYISNILAGQWIEYADRYNALCFAVEHRYYGKSHPTEDMSTMNLQYLTSQQALADLANFIETMNEMYNLPKDTKWIAFGGSYAGSLAAWIRLKYPHLVHGSLSASAPLLAKMDFSDYFKVVVESLKTQGEECVNNIREGIAQLSELLFSHIDVQRIITKKFQLCVSIEEFISNPKEVSLLYESITVPFARAVQYNDGIDKLCNIMTNANLGTPIERLAKINNIMLNESGYPCLGYQYDKMIQNLMDVSWDHMSDIAGRPWTYQTCTEFGFYPTSSHQPQIFGDQFPIDYFVQQCTDIFGNEFNKKFIEEAIRRTNYIYGGLDIEVDNVVFVHGSLDPWHALGVTNSSKTGITVINIEGTAHHAILSPTTPNDLPQLKAAKEQVGNIIGNWLKQ